MTHAPGSGRVIFIVEQRGVIKRATFEGGSWRKLGTFLDLRSLVRAGGEQGLLGLAFHPDYQANGLFYVDYTRRGEGSAGGDTVVAEYRRASDARADPGSRRVVLTVDQPAANHNGGHLAFGPDGFLYIALGDGGGAGDTYRNGQDRGTLAGQAPAHRPTGPGRLGAAPLCRAGLQPLGRRAWPGRDVGLGPAQPVALLLRPRGAGTCGSAMSARAPAKRSTARRRTPAVATPGVARTTAGAAARAAGATRRRASPVASGGCPCSSTRTVRVAAR